MEYIETYMFSLLCRRWQQIIKNVQRHTHKKMNLKDNKNNKTTRHNTRNLAVANKSRVS